jgi:hypothetical protein
MKTSLEDMLQAPVIDGWMYDTKHVPTMEEIEELMWIVVGDKEEFDFDIEDIRDRCVKVFKMDKDSLDLKVCEISIMCEE